MIVDPTTQQAINTEESPASPQKDAKAAETKTAEPVQPVTPTVEESAPAPTPAVAPAVAPTPASAPAAAVAPAPSVVEVKVETPEPPKPVQPEPVAAPLEAVATPAPSPAPEVSVAPKQEESAKTETPKVESDDEDDWEKKDEEDLKVAAPEVSLRPAVPGPFASTLEYAEAQWSPQNPTGKKIYNRDFLLQFRDVYTAPPPGIPILEDIKGGPARDKTGDRNWAANERGNGGGRAGSRGASGRGGRGGGKGRQGSAAAPKKGKQPPAPKVDLPNRQEDGKAWKRLTQQQVDENKALLLKANGLLNRLTVEQFENISNKLAALPFSTPELLTGVISLIFDKAVSQPKFAFMYARLCAKISSKSASAEDSEGQVQTFKRILLNQCQQEFEKGKLQYTDEGRAQMAALDKEAGRSEAEIQELDTQRRKRMLGNIKYIGELFIAKMLTEKIMHECIQRLIGDISRPIPEHMEALDKLLTTIGPHIDHPRARDYMKEYFNRIKLLAQDKKNSRIHFMLLNLIELRENGWAARTGLKESGPMSIQQVHKEAAEKERHEQMMNDAQLARSKRGLPPQAAPQNKSQGDWETVSAAKGRNERKPAPQIQPKGRGRSEKPRSEPSVPNMFAALDGSDDSNSPRPARAEKQPRREATEKREMDPELLETKIDGILQELFDGHNVEDAILSIKELSTPPSQNKLILDSIIIHAYEAGSPAAKAVVGKFLAKLGSCDFSKADFEASFEEAMEALQDISLDLPTAPTDFGALLGHSIVAGLLGIDILEKMPKEFIASKFRVKDERDCGKGAEVVCTLMQVLATVPEGKSLFGKTQLISYVFPDKRNQQSIEHLVRAKGLFAFFPEFEKPTSKSDQFMTVLKTDEKSAASWVKDNVKGDDAKTVLAAALQYVLKDNTSADMKEAFAVLRPLFKTNLKGMVAILEQIQQFCEKESERDSLKDIFEVLYQEGLMPIDGFKSWAKANTEANERLGSWLADKIEEEAQKLEELDEEEDDE